MIAEDLGVKIEWVPLTSPNRVPFLQTDKADIVIATLANTPERAEVIDFSKPYSGSFVVVSAVKSLDISKLEDLSGKDVGLTRGTTFDKIITEQAPKDTNIIRFDAEDTTLTALASGQVDIGVHNIAVLVNLQEMAPAREFEAKFVLQEVKFSIGVQKGASALVAYLDEFIAAHHADGSLNAAFKEYLGRDLPTSVTAP
jgi:polar amino acid transport system substrate-binding protein